MSGSCGLGKSSNNEAADGICASVLKGVQIMKEYFAKLYTGSAENFARETAEAMLGGKKSFVVTANPETLMLAEENEQFKAALLKESTRIIADGIGVVKGAAYLDMPVTERIAGVELSWKLLKKAGENGLSVYLYGAKQEVLDALVQRLEAECAGIKIAGAHNGYGGEDDKIFEDILAKKPDLVLIALGIPRQELLIDKYFDRAEKGIFIGVGGSFDVLSGTKKRAPAFFVKFNLEWLYRICKEPARFKRFYSSNVKFISKIKKSK